MIKKKRVKNLSIKKKSFIIIIQSEKKDGKMEKQDQKNEIEDDHTHTNRNSGKKI